MSATTSASPISSTPRTSPVRTVLVWMGVTLLAFPLGGLLGWAVGGHVDGVAAALVGGTLTGAGIGLGQWMVLRRLLGVSALWIVGTAVGLAAGLASGAAVVDYATDTGSLAVMGLVSGAGVGIVQGWLLRGSFSLWAAWLVAMPMMWAIGWVVSAAAFVDVENQFTVFGASGSVVFGLLSGMLLVAGTHKHRG